jgi:hypothetical protein
VTTAAGTAGVGYVAYTFFVDDEQQEPAKKPK